MYAIVAESADQLLLATKSRMSLPEPAARCSIKVSAAGVNRADLLQAAGRIRRRRAPAKFSGMEVSGVGRRRAAVAPAMVAWSGSLRSAWQAAATPNTSRSRPVR